MTAWENDLCNRATNRVVRPFEWGLDWIDRWPEAGSAPRNGHGPEEYIRLINEVALRDSGEFFRYRKPHRFGFDGENVTFASPISTPYPENDTVHLRYFPAVSKGKPARKAVVVLPHWNSSPEQHVALCRGLQKLGVSSVRISLPYHDKRMPPELQRADYAVSSNIGRTLDATRQAVADVRASIDWLETRGYESLAVVGTSLGAATRFSPARTMSGSASTCSITVRPTSPMWFGPGFRPSTSSRASKTTSRSRACGGCGT